MMSLHFNYMLLASTKQSVLSQLPCNRHVSVPLQAAPRLTTRVRSYIKTESGVRSDYEVNYPRPVQQQV
jgi:hypothetical protein